MVISRYWYAMEREKIFLNLPFCDVSFGAERHVAARHARKLYS